MKTIQVHGTPDRTPQNDISLKENNFYYIRWVFERIQRARDTYEVGHNLSMYSQTIFQAMGTANRYGNSEETFNFLYYYSQLNYAWFLITTNDQKPISFKIGDRHFDIIGRFKNSDIGAGFVIKGIETALILRNQQALSFCATIPVTFTEQANQQDLIWETMMYFYQTILKGKSNQDEAAAAYHHISTLLNWEEYEKYITVEGFNSLSVWKMVFDSRKPIAESIFLPTLAIYHAILHKDQPGFNRAVYEALLKWQAYYTVPKFVYEDGQEVDRAYESDGYLALPIAAACAYGYDHGMRLDSVESEYIPA
ncbi:immunity 49 family protein [Fibrella forsythiae]|uniref:Immunity 49 family protein n=1 Tax=Fibrella forsythiae TaxID=2817061 RepID=A0ABS3JSP5_9BACT|nr:immunity 49 family protein [Fibrella forsythiae]MBO0953031.1 immunity 49 family protein [Fibrella forsythiae]